MERRDLTPREEALYRLVLEQGQMPVAEATQLVGDEEALAYLLEFGLLAVDPEYPEVVAAGDPELAAARQSSRVLKEVVRDLLWLSRLPQSTASLTKQYLRAQESQSGAIEVVTGTPAIDQRLSMLLESCQERMLTIHPEATRPSATLQSVIGRDLDAVRRGADVRMLYLTPVRRQAAAQAYVEAVTAAGAGVRTLTHLPQRQFVIDDTVIIPYNGDISGAVFIQDPSTVTALVRIFDVLWQLGEDFMPRPGQEAPTDKTLVTVMRMLVDGMSTRQIARNMQLSERMVTRIRAEINEEYGTDSAIRLGWLLHERFPNGII